MKQQASSKRIPPLSIRLSKDERIELEERAERLGLSMGGYCKSVIFNTPPPRRSRRPTRDKAELARLMGQVSKLGNNVNQIARQLHLTSAVDIVELRQAINDLHQIRQAIMRALGYQEANPDESLADEADVVSEVLRESFQDASSNNSNDEARNAH
jgi:hypothetical protein